MKTIQARVRGFLTQNFYLAEPDALTDDASLLDHGIIDSTGVLEVIGFLEEAFGITLEDSEMVRENLDSIEKIARFVGRKSDTRAADLGPISTAPA